jgi:hypothetical protein
MRFRSIAVALVTLVFLAVGTSLVIASQGGTNNNGSGQVEYAKPGCGPDKTDGVAGGSGQHIGQPPKDQNRGDCPNPPGQNNGTNGTSNISYSSNNSSSSHGSGHH